ncbi:D-arabinono-1,4-lactone oxidase [Hyphomonas sp. FCG-A18]|uniref:D-arabinono-1,4-lactone oxidase n=1 Tax=Hyphomonas sp. FCG-A18 TaxID=3080019 RepID=UPI002B2A6E7B|nr:D-arabinono-1,4-lactone oxidase [Hyphomonas sp. FCG-A18]
MGLSRRGVLFGGLGVAAAGTAVPAGQHIAWGQKSFVREGYSPDYPEPPIGEDSWMNWSGIHKATPTSIPMPTTETELSELVAASPVRIRPKGSGHSFSGLVPSEGMIVDLSRLSGLLNYDPATGLATFGAGTTLFQAGGKLDELGRAFPNLPDIVDQTLAGSFSTGTHGTGLTLTALHDYIQAFRLVTANGDMLDVSADTQPDLFAAGKVSLGALGIITQYTLRTVPAFNLHRVVKAERIEDVLENAETTAEQYRNFEFFYLPGTGIAATLTHDLHEGPVTGVGPSEDDETLEGLKTLRDQFGWWPWLRRKIAQSALPSGVIEDVSDASLELLATTRPIKFNEMEYHLPRDQGIAALRQVIAKMDRRKDAFFPMEVRFIAPDSAWLSPFNDGPRISIAIHAAVDEPYEYFFSEFEPIFRAHGGRPHWGKLHSLGRAEFSALYPDYERFLELRRGLDPDGKFLNPHLATLFGERFDA